MTKVEIGNLVNGLREMDDDEITSHGVYDFLARSPISLDSLSRYLHWSDAYYTRNLVYKDDRFEVMAICWEIGQASQVHDHSDQLCWMAVPAGKLLGVNFAIDEIDESVGRCRLSETNTFELADCLAARVDLEEPVHQVYNPAEADDRAVSLHIYSKPYDSCRIYCRETDTFKTVDLRYTSIDGELC